MKRFDLVELDSLHGKSISLPPISAKGTRPLFRDNSISRSLIAFCPSLNAPDHECVRVYMSMSFAHLRFVIDVLMIVTKMNESSQEADRPLGIER